MITLGLIEAWFDREKGIYIQEVPVAKSLPSKLERFAFEVVKLRKVPRLHSAIRRYCP